MFYFGFKIMSPDLASAQTLKPLCRAALDAQTSDRATYPNDDGVVYTNSDCTDQSPPYAVTGKLILTVDHSVALHSAIDAIVTANPTLATSVTFVDEVL